MRVISNESQGIIQSAKSLLLSNGLADLLLRSPIIYIISELFVEEIKTEHYCGHLGFCWHPPMQHRFVKLNASFRPERVYRRTRPTEELRKTRVRTPVDMDPHNLTLLVRSPVRASQSTVSQQDCSKQDVSVWRE